MIRTLCSYSIYRRIEINSMIIKCIAPLLELSFTLVKFAHSAEVLKFLLLKFNFVCCSESVGIRVSILCGSTLINRSMSRCCISNIFSKVLFIYQSWTTESRSWCPTWTLFTMLRQIIITDLFSLYLPNVLIFVEC